MRRFAHYATVCLALLVTAATAQAQIVAIIVPAATTNTTPQFGNQITPLGSYNLQGDNTTTLTFRKIEVQILKRNANMEFEVYNNLQPQGAMVTGNNYSAAPYINLPAGTYKINNTLFYTQSVNQGAPMNKETTSSQTFTFP